MRTGESTGAKVSDETGVSARAGVETGVLAAAKGPAASGEDVLVVAHATAANLGPGFDCLGLALSPANRVRLRFRDGADHVRVEGHGAGVIPTGPENLLVRSARVLARQAGADLPGLEVEADNGVPLGRGLGSSAAAVVCGLVGVRALCGLDVSDEDLLGLACRIEGHADNAGACLYGGVTLTFEWEGAWRVRNLEAEAIVPIPVVSPGAYETAASRSLLADSLPRTDAVFNVARAALLVVALSGDPEDLLAATEDRLHEPARLADMPDTARLRRALRDRGIAAALSGSGPSLVVLASAVDFESTRRCVEEIVAETASDWRVMPEGFGSAASARRIPRLDWEGGRGDIQPH
ncbi:MAG: homoserine kinase [Actinomycetota bacterium]